MKTYDVIIIGGGPAGLVASKLVRGFGKKVAIVEANKLGGDCTHTGCVPSKTLLKAAKAFYDAQHLESYGFKDVTFHANPSQVMEHVRDVVAQIYAHETPEVFQEQGIDVITGRAKFVSLNGIVVNDRVYQAKKFIIATGSKALIPKLTGLKNIDYLTNENIFDLQAIPRSLIVVGNGVIAVEMATAFVRLGAKVTLVSRSQGILKNSDAQAAQIVFEQLQREGVEFVQEISLQSICQNEEVELTVLQNNEERILKASHILFATGRQPNVNLDLENAHVQYDNKGIDVNGKLQTSNKHIYAIGDVSSPYKFTHIAEQEAIVAGTNVVLPFSKSISYENIGWCVYSDPELAQIGLSLAQIQEKDNTVKEVRFEYKNTDRGYTDAINDGFIKVIVNKKGHILGATIVGERAGELIHQLQIAKTFGIAFQSLSKIVYIYPTFSDLIKYPAKQYYLQRLFEHPLMRLLQKVKGWFQGDRHE
jgi:pyruvate/2-oxoglutarate dehydrogenase complex dihydrolipoamide dehydrogenase (E3) component